MKVFCMEIDVLSEECCHIVKTVVVALPETIDVIVIILHQLLLQVINIQHISKLIMTSLLNKQWHFFSLSTFQQFCRIPLFTFLFPVVEILTEAVLTIFLISHWVGNGSHCWNRSIAVCFETQHQRTVTSHAKASHRHVVSTHREIGRHYFR